MSNDALYSETIKALAERKFPSVEVISQIDSVELAEDLLSLLGIKYRYAGIRTSDEQLEAFILKLDSYGVVLKHDSIFKRAVEIERLAENGLSAVNTRVLRNSHPYFNAIETGSYDGCQEEFIQLVSEKWQNREWADHTASRAVASYIRRYGFDEQIAEVFYGHSQLMYFFKNLETVLPYIRDRGVLQAYLNKGHLEVLSHEGLTEEDVLQYSNGLSTIEQCEALAAALRKYSRFL